MIKNYIYFIGDEHSDTRYRLSQGINLNATIR